MSKIMELADAYASAQSDVTEYLGASAGFDEQDTFWLAMKEARVALQAEVDSKSERMVNLINVADALSYTIEEMRQEIEALREKLAAARNAALEEAAKVCDDIDAEYENEDVSATWCAAAIRALIGEVK